MAAAGLRSSGAAIEWTKESKELKETKRKEMNEIHFGMRAAAGRRALRSLPSLTSKLKFAEWVMERKRRGFTFPWTETVHGKLNAALL